MPDKDPWAHVDAIGMILQSIDWSAVKMSATSPAGDRLANGLKRGGD